MRFAAPMIDSLLHFRYDILGFATSIALVIGYHYYLRWRLQRDRAYTIQGVNALARGDWVKSVMSSGGRDVLAVQTLRNSTMAATFLASTAILLSIGVLNLSEQGDKFSTIFQSVNYLGANDKELWVVKILCMLVDFLWAFFSFSLAIRMYNHVGYLINTPTNYCGHGNTPAYVGKLLNRGGWYYSIGMRSYYLSVPLIFWLFGPLLLLAATVGLIVVFYHVDRTPQELDEALPSGAESAQEALRARESRSAEVLSLR